MRTGVNAEAARGGATVPPPQASPSVYASVYAAPEKDPKDAEITPTVALTNALLSRGEGGGGGHKPSCPRRNAMALWPVHQLPVPRQLMDRGQLSDGSLGGGGGLPGPQSHPSPPPPPPTGAGHRCQTAGAGPLPCSPLEGAGASRVSSLAPVTTGAGGRAPRPLNRWWRLAVDGSWRLAVGGPLGRSLRAVLSKKKKKISSLKDPPGPRIAPGSPGLPPPCPVPCGPSLLYPLLPAGEAGGGGLGRCGACHGVGPFGGPRAQNAHNAPRLCASEGPYSRCTGNRLGRHRVWGNSVWHRGFGMRGRGGGGQITAEGPQGRGGGEEWVKDANVPLSPPNSMSLWGGGGARRGQIQGCGEEAGAACLSAGTMPRRCPVRGQRTASFGVSVPGRRGVRGRATGLGLAVGQSRRGGGGHAPLNAAAAPVNASGVRAAHDSGGGGGGGRGPIEGPRGADFKPNIGPQTRVRSNENHLHRPRHVDRAFRGSPPATY